MLSLLLLLVPLAAAAGPTPPLPVTVYYESLCPDSIKFFTSQLYTTYTSTLKPRFNLTLIPYGKSTHQANGEDFVFTCHHGENECYGNKIQACAIHYLSDESKLLALLNCLMGTALANKNGTYPIQKCGESTGVSVGDIVTCANTTQGSTLLAKLGDQTSAFQSPLKSVPTIVVNNDYTEQQSKEAYTNFRGLLCTLLKGDKPTDCSTGSASAAVLSTCLLALSVFLQFF